MRKGNGRLVFGTRSEDAELEAQPTAKPEACAQSSRLTVG